MDPHASFSNSHPANFRSPYQPYPAVPLNPNGVFLGSTVSQNLSHTPMYQGFFPNHSGSQVGYQNPPSFMFRERKGRVNWRNISSLDVDELIGKGDIRMLESYLSNISFANLEKEDIESFGDVNLLKLFRLSQYGLEYLLNCQNYLASQAQTLDYQYRASEEHLGPLEEQAKRNQAEILNLKNEINQKKDLVKAYQNSLSNPIYKCHLCPKLFKSQDFLNQHFQVRHENAISKGKKTPKVEPVPAPNPNTQQETAQMIEKLMSQLKQNEDLKLSQLTSSLQDRLQEVIKSNKELTAKVAEMEKKMDVERESGSVSSPDQPFNRTMRRDNPSIDPRQSIDDIQSRQTPKKHTIVKDLGSPKQSFRAGELEDGEITDRQVLKDEQKHKTQAFHAGSLNDFEEDRSSVKNPSVGTLKDVSEKEYPKLVFRAGELEDVTEEYKPMPKIAALPSQVTKGIKQTFKAGSMEDDEEEVGKQSLNKKHEEGGKNKVRKQVFNAGELEPELKEVKGLTKHFAGALEDDNDFVEARNRKRSQEDVVVMEEQEEKEEGERRLRKESHGRDGIRNTEEVDEDEIREQHKNAVVKAMNLIKNKYVHPIKNEEYEKAEKQVHKDLKSKCAKILNTDYDKLKDQSTSDLAEMEKALKLHTQKDAAPLQKLHNEYQNMTNQVQQPNNKQRLDSEEGSKSKSKLANLVVDPERSSKGMKSSIDKAGAKKQQVFESQNLDSQLGSYEELKIKYAQNAKDNGTNLMKKSIQGGAVEYL